MPKLISIVMSVKNEGAYLRQCLDSIVHQSYKSWELIVIDDHSEDNTQEILQEYSKIDSRISWEVNQGSGIIPALTQAYALSSGEYITRMDGDDLMPVDKLETLLMLLSTQPENTIVTGKVQYFSAHEVSDGYQVYENWLNTLCEEQNHAAWIYRECVLASPNWLCHRETLEKVGGFNGLNYPEDYDLVLKWYANGCRFIASQKVTHLWREHPKRTSRNSDIYEQKSFFRLKLPYFVRNFPNEQIYILGEGSKANMTFKILRELGVHPTQIVKSKSAEHEIEPKDLIRNMGIILVAVYPDEGSRREMIEFLSERGYEVGGDVFYV